MTNLIYYPPADRTAQWYAGNFPGTLMSRIRKVLWHTTEGSNWPSYEGSSGVKGAVAPQLTYHARAHAWHQHFPLNRSGRALQDPSSTPVKENRDEVVQVEIIASADQSYAAKHGMLYIANLDEQAIDDLGEFSAFMLAEWGVPLTKAPIWLPYPESYGNSDARMTSAEYDAFVGHLGHMHASGNSHGDPGAFPIDRVLAAARGTIPGKDDDVALTDKQVEDLAQAGWLAEEFGETGRKQLQLNRIETTLAQFIALSGQRWAQTQDALTAHDREEDNRYAELHQINEMVQKLVEDPDSPVTAETVAPFQAGGQA